MTIVLIALSAVLLLQKRELSFTVDLGQTSVIIGTHIPASKTQAARITGDLTGNLILRRQFPADTCTNVLSSIGVSKVVILSPTEKSGEYESLYQVPFSLGNMMQIESSHFQVNLGSFPIQSDIVTIAPNFQFTYSPNAFTQTRRSITADRVETEIVQQFRGFLLQENGGNLVVRLNGTTSNEIHSGESAYFGVFVLEVNGVEQFAINDQSFSLPDSAVIVLLSDIFNEIRIDSNCEIVANQSASNGLLDIEVEVPRVEIDNPSGTLTLGGEAIELSKGLESLSVEASDEYLKVFIQTEGDSFSGMVTGKTRNLMIHETEQIVKSYWQSMSGELRGTLLTLAVGLIGFMTKEIYDAVKVQ